ncbi:alpha beta-hydrolase [Dendrothele bispora CBS 962.96]|uniref:Carboxylic ester hydrolase n=1 Tax=Dendrothele bispora (strain CBS 962.96) TaxID=1314807 RepID=A0A4S8MXH7_DENBC|nr:alpha beta-hydrolase [Dendrothele bispora CBS 962.96]
MMLTTVLLVVCSLFASTFSAPVAPPPVRASSATTVNTPIGTAQGVLDGSGSAVRFAVKYASADRFASSKVSTAWTFPNNGTDPSALPLPCPQLGLDDSQLDEDCLSMLLFVPPSFNPPSPGSPGMPVMMWIHGGSFIVGSATAPGLDGSNLALATNSIVAVIQYRLGAFGFLSPDGTNNNAVRDVMNALQFLQNNVASFGGNPDLITIAGQSSGATMVRALLAVPEAEPLFKQAILQSDPMDFGFLSTTTQSTLQSYFASQLPSSCTLTDPSCLSTSSLLSTSMATFGAAGSLDPAAGTFSPMRPVHDGSLLTSSLDLTSLPSFPTQSKSILITNVLDEATMAIYSLNRDLIPEAQFPTAVGGTFDKNRTSTILGSSFYKTPPPQNGQSSQTVDARVQLADLGTDYLWKCPGWSFARLFETFGGHVFVGTWFVGQTYPGNEQVSECLESGVVCHQDDIEMVFGTVDNPSDEQKAVILEMQARYKMFLLTGNPNVPAFESWQEVEAKVDGDVRAKKLGGQGLVDVGSCSPDFWGEEVQYDYQVFGI